MTAKNTMPSPRVVLHVLRGHLTDELLSSVLHDLLELRAGESFRRYVESMIEEARR